MHPTLEIIEMEKYFGTLPVLKGISLTAAQGDVVALLGSSGSGKSTLLRCINLLETPDGGETKLEGVDVHYGKHKKISHKMMSQLRQKIGMVFQQFNLWPHLTILENLITAPICVHRKAKQEVIKQAKQLLEKVGIADKASTYPGKLSGGQQQRVAIARSLMMEPTVMLFDEPTSALDPEMTNEVLRIIKSLAAEGMTMLIATHEIGFAKEVATHALFLERGKIVEQGVARDMLTRPQTGRLQQFLGSMQY